MELSALKNKICESFRGSPQELQEILEIVENDDAVFPFNEYERLICGLINKGGLTYQQYIDIRMEYINENPHLWIFEISAPRGFGEKFAQTYIQGKCSKLEKPSKKRDPSFSGEYDFWLDGIRIEVKASRAVNADSGEPLYIKALSRNTEKPFMMNFQQLKPQYCDVFIWVAVFRDQIVLWVMGSQDVLDHALYSKGQHRGNKGNEGQLNVKNDNVHMFAPFELSDQDLEAAVRKACKNSAYISKR